MRVLKRRNKKVYSYTQSELTIGVQIAIIFLTIAILLLLFDILLSFIMQGEGGGIVGGIGLASIIFNIGSIVSVIQEIYYFRNFNPEIRLLLLFEMILFIVWIFIV